MEELDRHVRYGGISLHRLRGGKYDDTEVLRIVFLLADTLERTSFIVETQTLGLILEHLFDSMRTKIAEHAGPAEGSRLSLAPDAGLRVRTFECSDLPVSSLTERDIFLSHAFASWNADSDTAQIIRYPDSRKLEGLPKLTMPSSHMIELAFDLQGFFHSRHVYLPRREWQGLEFLKDFEPLIDNASGRYSKEIEANYLSLTELESRVLIAFREVETKTYRRANGFESVREPRSRVFLAATHAEAAYIARKLRDTSGLNHPFMLIGPEGGRPFDLESLDPSLVRSVDLEHGCIRNTGYEVSLKLTPKHPTASSAQLVISLHDSAKLLFDLYELLKP